MCSPVGKEYHCSITKMSSYLAEVRKLEKHFFGLQIQHIPRKGNFLADQLARMVSTRSSVPPGVFLEQLDSPSVVEHSEDIDVHKEVVHLDSANMDAPQIVDGCRRHDHGRDWMTSIYNYLQHDLIPEDDVEADRIARKPDHTLLLKVPYTNEDLTEC